MSPRWNVRDVRLSARTETDNLRPFFVPAPSLLVSMRTYMTPDTVFLLVARLAIIDSTDDILVASIHYLVAGSHSPGRDNACGA
jgi:hypothetical protein